MPAIFPSLHNFLSKGREDKPPTGCGVRPRRRTQRRLPFSGHQPAEGSRACLNSDLPLALRFMTPFAIRLLNDLSAVESVTMLQQGFSKLISPMLLMRIPTFSRSCSGAIAPEGGRMASRLPPALELLTKPKGRALKMRQHLRFAWP